MPNPNPNSSQVKFDENGYALCSDGSKSHFTRKEIACPCGCGFCESSQKMVDHMEGQRREIGVSIYILHGEGKGGWCRCESYNQAIGGASHSGHLTGEAADTYVLDISTSIFWLHCEKDDWMGLGSYPESSHKMIHLDVLPRYQRWVHRKGEYHYLL